VLNKIAMGLAGVAAVALVLTFVPDLAAYAWPLWIVSLIAVIGAGVASIIDRRPKSGS